MKKNVIFLICVKSQHKYLDDKHGGFKYFEFSINSFVSSPTLLDLLEFFEAEETIEGILTTLSAPHSPHTVTVSDIP